MSDTVVKTELTDAIYDDGLYVSGSWTTTYNSSGMIVSVTAAVFTVTDSNPADTTVFTDAVVNPFGNPGSNGDYEIKLTDASGGAFTNLYIDWSGETPTGLAIGTMTPWQFSSVEDNGVLETITSPSNVGTTVNTILCYCSGTRIGTPDGEVAVEDLLIGRTVISASGEAMPIRWIGHRTIDLARHPEPDLVRPIRIAAGALAEGVPLRDLLVSPDHAMLVDGALIPARMLVNHRSITEEMRATTVTYYHVELDSHAIIIADGAQAESYLDTGNRHVFANAPVTAINPDMSVANRLRMPEYGACMPLVTDAEVVFPIWQRLAERGGAPVPRDRGTISATGKDGCIRLVVGSRTVRPVVEEGGTVIFALPRDASQVRLISASARPNAASPWLDDRRLLGVAVRDVRADHTVVPLDGPAFGTGWWDLERAGATAFRWSNGDAVIALPKGTKLLKIQLQDVMCEASQPVRSEAA